jgi:hypothetical protein
MQGLWDAGVVDAGVVRETLRFAFRCVLLSPTRPERAYGGKPTINWCL